MSEKVVGLDGRPALAEDAGDSGVRAVLEGVLKQNREGGIKGAVVLTVHDDGKVGTWWHWPVEAGVAPCVGALEVLKFDLLMEAEKRYQAEANPCES